MSDTEMGTGAGMEEEEEVTDLTNPDVVTKYKKAADIANNALRGVVIYAKAGMSVLELCKFADNVIVQQCESVYKSKKIEKGVAFPACVSVNDCVCHYSPLESEKDIPTLAAGDLVKVDLGVHIDGYIVVGAHSFIIPGEGVASPVTGKKADVMLASYYAAEAAVKLIKPGMTNQGVTEMIKQVCADFGVNAVQGVLMHQMKRFVIDGNQVVIGREELDQKVDETEFEAGQVYTVDVVMSTGEGKPIQREARTTVFKRAVETNYMLKMKASRYVLKEVNSKFPTLPFTIRALGDEKQARMGVVECVKHDLFHPYPVLFEKQEDLVAHFKYTVLLLPSGTVKVTGHAFDVAAFQSEKECSETVKAILATSAKNKKKKKKNKAAAPAADAAEPPKPMETD